ncbi:hypothetical protein LH464_14705 [Neorhizobium sp. T786]|uniref:hypothetical protein n=1 Tax=Pseudorhizobium xiangyangii TaxID=2883104 RepID=UPI001CFFF937|nr:hypothetical protein [Neorhizobium xiangyangii]MCB5203727.1 hypothetical protein [Neorhizobium xiangyangii]
MSEEAKSDNLERMAKEGPRPGADVSFPFDRMTVEQFRKRFPRARWSDSRQAWFVPGRTASRRFTRWLADLEAEADAFADAKGRDSFEFEPIESVYLELGKAGFRIKTPYSRTVVDRLREVPYSRWDGDLKLWHVPYRSFEDLRHHWPVIEEAARRNEPEERRRRAEARKGTEEEAKSRARTVERNRRRYPLTSDDLPPVGCVVAIHYGLVVFEEITGELVDLEVVGKFYHGLTDDHVWGIWRLPTYEELVRAWPSKTAPAPGAKWWQPTIEELRPVRRAASRKRRNGRRSSSTKPT